MAKYIILFLVAVQVIATTNGQNDGNFGFQLLRPQIQCKDGAVSVSFLGSEGTLSLGKFWPLGEVNIGPEFKIKAVCGTKFLFVTRFVLSDLGFYVFAGGETKFGHGLAVGVRLGVRGGSAVMFARKPLLGELQIISFGSHSGALRAVPNKFLTFLLP